ncbi:MAG: DinB family protein [Dehalococcoidia bacterium]
MTGSKDDLQKYYAGALQRCLDMFGRLDAEDWQASANRGSWTARDYLGHLITRQEQGINATISQGIAGQPVNLPGFTQRSQVAESNASILETVGHLTPQQLLSRFQATFEENIRLLESLSEAELRRPVHPPVISRPGTVKDMFAVGYFHLMWHYQDIRHCIRKRRTVPHWCDLCSADDIHHLLDTICAMVPLAYWPERGGNLQATFLFSMQGKGGGQWTLQVADGQCRSHEGAPERADVEVRVTPADWISVFTKDLNPFWALITRRMRVRGKLRLMMGFDRLFEIG